MIEYQRSSSESVSPDNGLTLFLLVLILLVLILNLIITFLYLSGNSLFISYLFYIILLDNTLNDWNSV